MARASNRRRSAGGFRDINITPLVDVMLVLLIVFMITAPLLTAGLPVDLPNVRAEPSPIQDVRLVVSVTADERVVYRDADITDEVEQVFASDRTLQTAGSIYVRADQNVRYGAVARVVAAARTAGVRNVHLVVEPEER
jgi:biopolymer transport protein TolR